MESFSCFLFVIIVKFLLLISIYKLSYKYLIFGLNMYFLI
jgi:hypothetical protein